VSSALVKIAELQMREVSLIEGNVQFTLHLGPGALGKAEKFDELRITASIEASATLCIREPEAR
jgi:hypothetical protein